MTSQHKQEESELREGMRVEYHAIGGSENTPTTTGTIKHIIKHDDTVGSSPHHVKADPEHPRFVIENDNTHKLTPYKKENIVRVLEED